jgi:predicted ester cyclase
VSGSTEFARITKHRLGRIGKPRGLVPGPATNRSITPRASWSGVSFEIESAFETDDAVIVQAVRRGTITGSWRSMESPGRSVSFPLCTICKFNADNKIVYEEAYYDMQAISRQLGYHPAAAR